jgi:cytochrome c biogenesis protein CcdA
LGWPRPAIALASLILGVGLVAGAYVLMVPFDTAAFGGLTVPTVLASGFADGFNPCAFALLVLFATYTLTLVNAVTGDNTPTLEARRRLLGAGSLYVMAVLVTYFIIGLGLFTFLSWLGRDHLVARGAAILALGMALWMLKDVFLPGVGPSMMAPGGTHGRMQRAMERGGLGGLALLALYNIAFIVPLLILLLSVSNRRVLGQLGRWNRQNSPWIKTGLALAVIAMSFGLMVSM